MYVYSVILILLNIILLFKDVAENTNKGSDVMHNNIEELSADLKDIRLSKNKGTNSNSCKNDLIFPIDM